MGLRGYYDEKMEQIRAHIVEMGALSTLMIDQAVESALSGNPEPATAAIDQDDQVDVLEEQVIRDTVMLVMQEAPVAGDLRMLTSTLGVIGELEKVADDAVKLARRAHQIGSGFPGEMRAALIDLGSNAKMSLASALRLYTEYDPELATQIINFDEKIDLQYAAARQRLVQLVKERPDDAELTIITMSIFQALEHIADHAVSIAKRLRVHYESAPQQVEHPSS